MSKFNDYHPYVEALFHAMLAEQDNWKVINEALIKYYPNIYKWYQIEDDTDRAYILDTYEKLIVAISGTKSKKGWVRNFLCWPDDGWHYGFKRSFKNTICEPFIFALKKFHGKKIYIFGHSAGPAIGLNLNYYIRSVLNRPCESIGFCAPQIVNRIGKAQCRKAHVCYTALNIGWRDQVDNIAKLIGGKNYGYTVEMPDAGKPKADRRGFIDDGFIGHAPSYVCVSLKKLFDKWGIGNQFDIIDEISKYAVL